MTSENPIHLAPLATADLRVRSTTREEERAQAVRYKGFVIAARPYQLRESNRWTVDVDLRRNGHKRSFSAQETCRTLPEAEALCFSVGRRIIDGKIPGWSVDQLRGAPSRWSLLRFRKLPWIGRPLLVVGSFAFGLAAFLLLEGAAFPSSDPTDAATIFDAESSEPHPMPLWVASAGLMTGAMLVVAGVRRTP